MNSGDESGLFSNDDVSDTSESGSTTSRRKKNKDGKTSRTKGKSKLSKQVKEVKNEVKGKVASEKIAKVVCKNQFVQTLKNIGKKSSKYQEIQIDMDKASKIECLAAEFSNIDINQLENQSKDIHIDDDNLEQEIKKYFVSQKQYQQLKNSNGPEESQYSKEQLNNLRRNNTINNLNILQQLENLGLTKEQINSISTYMGMTKQDIIDAGFTNFADFKNKQNQQHIDQILKERKQNNLDVTEPIYNQNQIHASTLTNKVIIQQQLQYNQIHQEIESDSQQDDQQMDPNDKKINTNYIFKVTEEVQVDSYKDFIRCVCIHCKQNIKQEQIAEVLTSEDLTPMKEQSNNTEMFKIAEEQKKLLANKNEKITILQKYLTKVTIDKQKLIRMSENMKKSSILTLTQQNELQNNSQQIEELQKYEDTILKELQSFQLKTGTHLSVVQSKKAPLSEHLNLNIKSESKESAILQDIQNKVFNKKQLMNVKKPLKNLNNLEEPEKLVVSSNIMQRNTVVSEISVPDLIVTETSTENKTNIETEFQSITSKYAKQEIDEIEGRFDNLKKPRQQSQQNHNRIQIINDQDDPLSLDQVQADIKAILNIKSPQKVPLSLIKVQGKSQSLNEFQNEIHNQANFYKIKENGNYENPFKKLIEDKLQQGIINANKQRIQLLQNKISLKKLIQFQLKKQEAKIKLLQNPERSFTVNNLDQNRFQTEYFPHNIPTNRDISFQLIRQLQPDKPKINFELVTKFNFDLPPTTYNFFCNNFSFLTSITNTPISKDTQNTLEFIQNHFKIRNFQPHHLLIADQTRQNKIIPQLKSRIFFIVSHKFYKSFMSFAPQKNNFIICDSSCEIKPVSWITNISQAFLSEFIFEIERNVSFLAQGNMVNFDQIIDDYLVRNYGLDEIVKKHKFNFVANSIFYQQSPLVELVWVIFSKQITAQGLIFVCFLVKMGQKEQISAQEAQNVLKMLFPTINQQTLESEISKLSSSKIPKFSFILLALSLFQCQKHQIFALITDQFSDEIPISDAENLLHKVLPYVPRTQFYDILGEQEIIKKADLLALISKVGTESTQVLHVLLDKMVSLEKYLSTFVDRLSQGVSVSLEGLRACFYQQLECKNEISSFVYCEVFCWAVVRCEFSE